MSNRPIEELVKDLESGLASPVARDIRVAVLNNDRKRGIKCIGEEISDKEDCARLFDYFREKWSAKAMKLRPLPKECWEDAVVPYDLRDESREYPRYLVRVGTTVFLSFARVDRWTGKKSPIYFSDSEHNEFGFNKIDEIFEITFER